MRSSPTLASSAGLLLLACSSPAPPAEPPAAARPGALPFLPADYTGELFVDYAALRNNRLLGQIERLPMMEGMLDAVAQAYGCELDDLQRVRTALVFDDSGGRRSIQTVSVAEVDPAATAAPMPEPWRPWERDGMQGFHFEGSGDPGLLVRPRPGLVVAGQRQLVEPLLQGPPGGPHPELAPFLAGERVLVQFAVGTFGRPAHTLTGTIGFYGHDEPDDPVEFLRLRLSADADESLTIAVTMRYRPGSQNLRRTAADAREFLDRLREDPEFAGLKPLLAAIAIGLRDPELEYSLDLGPPAAAMRTIERAVIAIGRIGEARLRR
jgi:hypothetical protein